MKIYLSVFVIFTISSCGYTDTEVHGKYFGRGVCSVHLRDEKWVDVNELHFYNETSLEFCWSFPPWCKVVTSESFSYSSTPEKIPHEHLKLKCCPGYKSNAGATECLPICSLLCAKDHCIDVGNCTLCIPGYAGPQCDKKVANTTAAPFISTELPTVCNCTDDNYVCAYNGSCVCAPSFSGTDCTTIVDPDAFIDDPGVKASCMTYIIRISIFLALLALSFVLIFAYIRQHFGISNFKPLLDDSVPSTSRSYTSI